jgi:putative ABC transport system permease protein
MKFLPYILKTLWRHRSRTLLTVSGAAVALFVFAVVGSVQEGMRDLARRQAAERTLVTFQANKFCPATSHLPQDYERKVMRVAGVRDVVPIQVYTNNCRASLDVIVFYGVPPQKLQTARDFQLQRGDWADFEKHQDAAVVGRAVAARRGLDVGDKFSIGGITVSIAGVYSSQDPAEENYIYCHLDFLQRRNRENLAGTVTQLEILLNPNANADSACKDIDELFRGGPVATDTRPKGVFQAQSLGDLTQLLAMAQWLGFACVGLVLTLVATTTIMSVQDRIKEHAVLQTIGFSSGRVFSLVLIESVLLGIAGGILGSGAAVAVLAFSQLSVGAEAVTVAFTPSWRLAVEGLGVSAIAGFLAGLAPAWQASRVEIVPALRAS